MNEIRRPVSPRRSIDVALTLLGRENMKSNVDQILLENTDARNAHQAMIKNGRQEAEVTEEIARAFQGCVWEINRGMPARFKSVFQALARGKSTAELFPDELYEGGQTAQ